MSFIIFIPWLIIYVIWLFFPVMGRTIYMIVMVILIVGYFIQHRSAETIFKINEVEILKNLKDHEYKFLLKHAIFYFVPSLSVMFSLLFVNLYWSSMIVVIVSLFKLDIMSALIGIFSIPFFLMMSRLYYPVFYIGRGRNHPIFYMFSKDPANECWKDEWRASFVLKFLSANGKIIYGTEKCDEKIRFISHLTNKYCALH